MVQHHDDYSWKEYYERTYGKRPRFELYDLNKDPDQINNIAGKPELEKAEAALHERLVAELTRTNAPRVTSDRLFYETAPMTNGD